MDEKKKCINCNRPLLKRQGVWLCIQCNSDEIDVSQIFIDPPESDETIFIECPGATLYEPGTNSVVGGVEYNDNDDPTKGYKIIGESVFAPNHSKRRRIKRDAIGSIRRCQACQDYTIRMRRREGADFCIPSSKFPSRTSLKTVHHVSYEP
jgi:hypothetical protein